MEKKGEKATQIVKDDLFHLIFSSHPNISNERQGWQINVIFLFLAKIIFKPEEFRWPWAPEPEPFPVWMPTTELEGAESILASDRW